MSFLTNHVSASGGGLQTAQQGLARALRARGLDLTVVGTGDPALQDAGAGWDGVTVRTCRPSGPASFGFAPGMGRALRRGEPAVVHQHGLWTWASVCGARWGASRPPAAPGALQPRVVSPHSMLDPWPLSVSRARKHLALRLFERRNLESAGCLHALTDTEREGFRALGLRVPVCVIPNGVDRESATELPARVRDAVGDGPIALFLGRVTEKKNIAGLIDAWGAIERAGDGPRWRLVVAGWGSDAEEAALRDRLDRARLRRVAYVGSVFGGAKAALLDRADAFVLPSFSEGIPMAALEAMAHRTPALISDECNLAGAIGHGALRIGTAVDEIADGLREVMVLPRERLARLGADAAGFVEDHYEWGSVAARFERVYRWLAGQADVPDSVEPPG